MKRRERALYYDHVSLKVAFGMLAEAVVEAGAAVEVAAALRRRYVAMQPDCIDMGPVERALDGVATANIVARVRE